MKKLFMISGVVLWWSLGFGDWWIATVDSDFAVTIDGYGSSIVLDDSGCPHIAYSRSFNSMHYASFNPKDSSWAIEFVDSSYCPRMKFDSMGFPHIACMYKYLYRDTTGAWNKESGFPWGYDHSFDLDSKDWPHIADEIRGDTLIMHWYKDSVCWHCDTVDNKACMTDVSMVIDDEDVIHLTYLRCPQGDSARTWYAKKVGGVWCREVIDTTYPLDWDMNFSIALDTSGFPCVAYVRDDVPNRLKFARRDSVGWKVEVVDSTWDLMYNPALCIDKNNYPRIAYFSEWHLKYAWFDGSSWNITIVDKHTMGLFFTFIEMAIDSEGYCHIAYDNQQTNTRKYAKGHGFAGIEENINYQLSITNSP